MIRVFSGRKKHKLLNVFNLHGTCQGRTHRIHCLLLFVELLGIKDLSKHDYGDPVACQPGDVPVFWPSQMTSLEAVSSCSTSGLKGGYDYDPGWKRVGL